MVDVKNTLEELKEESDTGRLNEKQAPPQTVSNRIRWWAYLSVIAVAAVAGAGAWFVHSKSGRAEGAPRPIPLTTDPGWEVSPSLSPDGNQVAFTWFRAESNTPNSQIYVKLIGAGEPLRLTNGLFDSAPSWSPDGRWIAFQRYQPPDTFELRIITVLGGAERKLVSLDGATTFSWSADSKWIACGNQRNPKGLTEIALISTESAEKQVLLAARSALEDVGYPAFAPDGKKLGFVRGSRATGSDLFVLPLTPELKAGGEPIQLTHDGENKMGLAWTADSADVVFAAGAYDQTLWRVNSSGRSERHLLGVGPGASQPSISARGQKLAYAQGSFDVNIWRIGKTGKGAVLDPSRFISSTRFEHSAQYSPDGRRIAFTSNRSGSFEIWVTDSAGTRPVQITAFGRNESGSPRWSPDGKSIAFDSNAEGQLFQIYTINADGGKPLRLTDGAFENAMPCWSQDGKWIYFESSRTGRSEIWKVSANGGEPHQITTNGGYTAVESADGKWLYFTATGDVPTSLKVMPVEGGPEREVLKSVNPRNFAVTKRGIYYQAYMPSDPDQLASFDFGTKQSRTILVFKSGSYAGLSSSPDERYILYAAYDQIASDLRLLENFQ